MNTNEMILAMRDLGFVYDGESLGCVRFRHRESGKVERFANWLAVRLYLSIEV